MKIAVIDAQGAGLGQNIIKRIRKEIDNDVYIIALGTNSFATSKMVQAGANVGISGERAISSFCKTTKIDSIIGPIGIICSGGINGEITTMISNAIFNMDCTKYILPLQNHGIYIPGTRNLQIKDIIEEIVLDIKNNIENF
ncbi:DUF3842 family protein [Clostridium diolis]|uniref:DUF3842 family protein n=1 Tax=Clostridium diolis TaxID=223919 RepID=A0AAV3W4Y7_9CLOT|nr:DUF3842 family protein [Clostridium diolis]QES74749.1 DUF3842 family protein [Clostridium diolis]GEA32029.1 hypothetical protein CDIOL_29520 [Clostridium diolis]